MKNKVIENMCSNEDLFNAINSPSIANFDESYDLINTHIFRYNKNPKTIKESIAFITVQVHIPKTYDPNKIRVKPILEIYIYCHHSKMDVPNKQDSRTDYISRILDEMLNGRDDFGLGQLMLYQNDEGTFSDDYLFRHMVFETTDFNKNMCGIK